MREKERDREAATLFARYGRCDMIKREKILKHVFVVVVREEEEVEVVVG